MPTKIVDTILPTTMVGSYPRPHWYKHQLLGRDIRVAFKEVEHEEAYHDATQAVIHDQEEAGLDIVTDGQMSFDDYVGVIGSFCWYMYERIGGFDPAREPHPSMVNAGPSQGKEILDDWGGVINSGPVSRGPIRLADLYKVAAKHAKCPIKVSVGAGPANLSGALHLTRLVNEHNDAVANGTREGKPLGADAWAVLDFRVAVEAGATLLAVERAEPDDLVRLEELVDRMAEVAPGEDFGPYRRADIRFHISIAAAARSPRLVSAMTEVHSQMSDLITLIAHPPEVLLHSNEQHRRLVEMLRRRDAVAAVRLMREHIEGTEHILAGLI